MKLEPSKPLWGRCSKEGGRVQKKPSPGFPLAEPLLLMGSREGLHQKNTITEQKFIEGDSHVDIRELGRQAGSLQNPQGQMPRGRAVVSHHHLLEPFGEEQAEPHPDWPAQL